MKKVIIIFISIVFLNSCFNENNTKNLEEIRKTELVKIKEPKKEILKISEKEEFLNFVTKIGKNVDLLKTINCKKIINVKILKYCNEKKIAYLKSINNSQVV